MDRSLSRPIDADLLQTKRLDPSTEQIATLEHVAKCDVSEMNEPEVRATIIDPIVRVLGYEAGTVFSSNLERHIKFRGQVRKGTRETQE